MELYDVVVVGMFLLVIMGVVGMYLGSVDLSGVVTIEGLAVALSLAAAQLQKYKCQLCPYYPKTGSKDIA